MEADHRLSIAKYEADKEERIANKVADKEERIANKGADTRLSIAKMEFQKEIYLAYIAASRGRLMPELPALERLTLEFLSVTALALPAGHNTDQDIPGSSSSSSSSAKQDTPSLDE